jgi:hypothetical protein
VGKAAEKDRTSKMLTLSGLGGGETSASPKLILDLPHRLIALIVEKRLFLEGRLWSVRGPEFWGSALSNSNWTFATSANRPDKKAELTVESAALRRSVLTERFRRLMRGTEVVSVGIAETGPSYPWGEQDSVGYNARKVMADLSHTIFSLKTKLC